MAQQGLQPGPSPTAQTGPESIGLGLCKDVPRVTHALAHWTDCHCPLFGTVKASPTLSQTDVHSQDSENHKPEDHQLRPGLREDLGCPAGQSIPRNISLGMTLCGENEQRSGLTNAGWPAPKTSSEIKGASPLPTSQVRKLRPGETMGLHHHKPRGTAIPYKVPTPLPRAG